MLLSLMAGKFVLFASIGILFSTYRLSRDAAGADNQHISCQRSAHELARLTLAGLTAGIFGAIVGMFVMPDDFSGTDAVNSFIARLTLCGFLFGIARIVPGERVFSSVLPILSSQALLSRLRSSSRPRRDILYMGNPLSHRLRALVQGQHRRRPPILGPLMESYWMRLTKGRCGLAAHYLTAGAREASFNALQYESFAVANAAAASVGAHGLPLSSIAFR